MNDQLEVFVVDLFAASDLGQVPICDPQTKCKAILSFVSKISMYVCNFSKGPEKPLAESGLPGDSLMKSYFHHCNLVQTDDSHHGFQSLMDLAKSLKGQDFERSCEAPD